MQIIGILYEPIYFLRYQSSRVSLSYEALFIKGYLYLVVTSRGLRGGEAPLLRLLFILGVHPPKYLYQSFQSNICILLYEMH